MKYRRSKKIPIGEYFFCDEVTGRRILRRKPILFKDTKHNRNLVKKMYNEKP